MPGIAISEIEVSLVSKLGFWLRLENETLSVPFELFPWFEKATVEQITFVERPTANHLYWPILDIDLAVNSIRDPGAFPLLARI